MENTNKIKTVVIVVLSVLVVALAVYIVMKRNALTTGITGTPVALITGDTADFVSLDVTPGQKISGKGTILGSVKGGYFFEAQARIQLLDGNKKVLKTFPATATSEWMTSEAVSFSATIDTTGIAAGAGYIRIANDNPSGDTSKDKSIDIPVVFQ